MTLPREAMLLRIYLGEDDKFQHQPLYEAIVLKARERQLAGATVLRGPMGFGHSSHLHTAKILRLRRTCRWWWISSIARTRFAASCPNSTA